MPYAASPSAPTHEPVSPVTAVCDLAEANPFVAFTPHAPVLLAFGGGCLHQYQSHGSWDLERAVADAPDVLFRSVRRLNPEKQERQWDDLTFRLGPRAFLYADAIKLVGYADTALEAERLVTEFSARYAMPPVPAGGRFHLITSGREISTEAVPLNPETLLDPAVFRLHYGEEGWTWHGGFADRLVARHHGLSIFEGPPGTGKTSYLRHLMGTLQKTHRFYFIPPATLNVLSAPEFIGFWAGQRTSYKEQRFVVILEDADAALMTRANDNRGQVSAILNLSDGMMGDFLRLQIVCTINCRAEDIDPALLRPGRLLCHRVFPRLDVTHARRLAGHLGRRLPTDNGEDFSLAEVYAGRNGRDTPYATRPRLGFMV